MKTRQRIRKSDADVSAPEEKKKATHRLSDIDVSEVSIVDRGANQRTYLVVKNAEEESSKQEATKAGETPPPNPPSQPSAPAAPTPPTILITAETQQQVLGVLKAAQERIGVIAKVVEGASVTPGAPVPSELTAALGKLAELFKAFQTATQPAPPSTDGAQKGEESSTEKAGRKLSGARLAQLTQMRTTLDSLIAEVQAAVTSDSTSEATGDDDGSDTSTTEKNESTKAPVSDDLTEIKTVVAALVESVGKMTQVFESQNQRISELSKSRGGSRQADLDTPNEPKTKKVVWDLDMASPLKTVQ